MRDQNFRDEWPTLTADDEIRGVMVAIQERIHDALRQPVSLVDFCRARRLREAPNG